MNKITDKYEGTTTTGRGSFDTRTRITIGVCDLCGGSVTRPEITYYPSPTGEHSDSCGAVPAPPKLPVLKMVKP